MISYFAFLFKNKKMLAYFYDHNKKIKLRWSLHFNKIENGIVFYLDKKKEIEKELNKYFFLMNKAQNTDSYSSIDELYRDTNIFGNDTFKNIKYIVYISGASIIPIAIRNTNPFINYIFVARNYDDLFYANSYAEFIDFLLYDHKLNISNINVTNLKNIIEFENLSNLANIFTEINNKLSKKSDVRRVYSKVSTISINDGVINVFEKNKLIQGVLVLERQEQVLFTCFDQYLENLERNISEIYLRDNIFFAYENLCKSNNPFLILRKTLSEGVRYECTTY